MALYERIIFPDPRSLVTCCLYESVDYFLYECHKRFTIKDCRLLVPGGYVPTLETKQRECWKLRDSRLNPKFDSRVHGKPLKINTCRRSSAGP